MYRNKKVCVVVPAFNEEVLIARMVLGIPDFVDHIIVIDDGSTDRTSEIVKKLKAKISAFFLSDTRKISV